MQDSSGSSPDRRRSVSYSRLGLVAVRLLLAPCSDLPSVADAGAKQDTYTDASSASYGSCDA